MKYIINLKAEDLVATTPDAIRYTQGAPLVGILETVLNDVDFRLEVDRAALLAENCQIAHVWGTDDVRQLRPDLDDDQAWAVLQLVEEKLEQDVGISREMVERIAEVLYPDKPERHWQGRIDVSVENYTRDAAIEHFEAMAETIERQSVNSTMRAVFDPASLRLAGRDETTNRQEAPMRYDDIRATAFAIILRGRGEAGPADRLVGLLADARLWCDANGQSFGELDRRAYQQYLTLINHETPNR